MTLTRAARQRRRPVAADLGALGFERPALTGTSGSTGLPCSGRTRRTALSHRRRRQARPVRRSSFRPVQRNDGRTMLRCPSRIPASPPARLLAACRGGRAAAHPHVFVTSKSEIVYAKPGRSLGIRQIWTFDDMFSSFATQGLDTDKDGKLSREELAPLAQTNVESLKEFDYFTFAKLGSQEAAPQAAGGLLARLHRQHADAALLPAADGACRPRATSRSSSRSTTRPTSSPSSSPRRIPPSSPAARAARSISAGRSRSIRHRPPWPQRSTAPTPARSSAIRRSARPSRTISS